MKRNALIKNPHKITFINSDIFESIDTKEKFDVIVSNPPYISIQDKQNLQPEVVLHEPHLALFTEDEKGISFYEKLAFQAKNRLNKNGYLAVEIGIYQAADVVKIFENAGMLSGLVNKIIAESSKEPADKRKKIVLMVLNQIGRYLIQQSTGASQQKESLKVLLNLKKTLANSELFVALGNGDSSFKNEVEEAMEKTKLLVKNQALLAEYSKHKDKLKEVKEKLGLPILSDVHCRQDVKAAAEVLDIIQIPAFLSRQTDLLVEAARTGRVVNIKKGQFLAPWDMAPSIKKIEASGNKNILITERGISFGYNNLVSDLRALAIIRDFGYPVIYDATHSVQLPGGGGSCSGGERRFVPGLSRAAVAFGCDGLFLEVHPDPDKALCDGPNMVSLKELKALLKQVKNIERALK